MKIFIFVWWFYQGLDNEWKLHGIGDLLRGMIHSYILCERYNLKFIIDYRNHPIHHLINYEHHEYEVQVDEEVRKKSIKVIFGDITNEIGKFVKSDKKILFATTNAQDLLFSNMKVTNSYPVKSFFNFNDEIIKDENRIYDYNLVHIRLGDDEIKGIPNNKHLYERILNKINNIPNILVISDSYVFKIFLKNRNIRISKNIPQHIGLTEDIHDMVEILNDMYLIKNSNRIYYYGIYPWISGFIKWPALSYNIPLIKLNI